MNVSIIKINTISIVLARYRARFVKQPIGRMVSIGGEFAVIFTVLVFLSIRADAQPTRDSNQEPKSEDDRAEDERQEPKEPASDVTPDVPRATSPNTSDENQSDKREGVEAIPNGQSDETGATEASPRSEPAENEAADQSRTAADATSDEEESSALPKNVPVDEEGVFLGQDHTGTPDKPALVSEPPEQSETWTDQYDGRPPGRVKSEEVLIWIPRTLLFPVHLALDYLVRRPIVGLVTLAEEHYVFERVVDFFTFADGDAAIYPSAFYDSGRGFWAAGNFFYKNAWVEGHKIDAFAGYGTSGWFDITLGDRWMIFENNSGTLGFTGTFAEDPTLSFTGIGPDTAIDDEVFFSQRKGEARTSLRVAFGGLNRFGVRMGFRNAELSGGRNPSIDAPNSPFDVDNLPGFDDEYNLLIGGFFFELDTRSPDREFTAGSGIRLEGFGDFGFSVAGSDLLFFRYGARPAAFWDISGTNHVLILSLYAEAISRVNDEPLPITELISLGGEDYLRGFVLGRFRGESALVHSLVYTWPVLIFLDGIIFTELGNAFEGFYRDFAYDKMVLDWGFGLRTNLSREFGFNILFAFGTNQIELWDQDFAVDNFRFAVGATRAF